MELLERSALLSKGRYFTNLHYINTPQLFKTHYDDIMKLPYWVVDTETTGLDFLTDKVTLMQLGNKDIQYVIDTRVVDPRPFAEKLEDDTFTCIVQYAIFDYLMLKSNFNITMERIRDPYIAEKLLTLGLSKSGFGMETLCKKYLQVSISKSLQTSFVGHSGEFSKLQLEYAAFDCVYPDHYFRRQRKRMLDLGLNRTFQIECNAIPAFGDSTYYGMLLDEGAWRQNMYEEGMGSEHAKAGFIKSVTPYLEPDLFGEVEINPASPEQVLGVFSKIYPKDLLIDPSSKEAVPKPSTGDGVLEQIIRNSDYPEPARHLVKFRGHEKNVGTYGESYINAIRPETGRFHPRMESLGTSTTRPAGRKPNMLNIPRDKRYRKPWVAGPGRKILTNDYGACELRIMASMSGDPVMCEGFNRGIDYHTFTANQFITDDNEFLRVFIPHPKGEAGKGKYGDFILNKKGEKQPNPEFGNLVCYERVTGAQRTVAKTINFGLAYGMGPKKLSIDLNIQVEKAREYIQKFRETFKVLVKWLENQQRLALENLCAESLLGTKRWFWEPRYTWKPEWNDISFDPKNPWDEKMPKEMKKYHQQCASIKREGGNFPIQCGNANVTKIAMYELRKFFKSYEKEHNNGEYLAHIALQVYDELIVDCPEHLADFFAQKMDEIMKEAGRQVITKVPVETGCIIDDTWVKG